MGYGYLSKLATACSIVISSGTVITTGLSSWNRVAAPLPFSPSLSCRAFASLPRPGLLRNASPRILSDIMEMMEFLLDAAMFSLAITCSRPETLPSVAPAPEDARSLMPATFARIVEAALATPPNAANGDASVETSMLDSLPAFSLDSSSAAGTASTEPALSFDGTLGNLFFFFFGAGAPLFAEAKMMPLRSFAARSAGRTTWLSFLNRLRIVIVCLTGSITCQSEFLHSLSRSFLSCITLRLSTTCTSLPKVSKYISTIRSPRASGTFSL
mmetsp:Transcript_12297/g.19373  ORF Transcript_12297/g.19373 Transcript_12297/m.19373 type:complete len:271 (-) Transcript_12297:333-1145(-)